MHEQNLMNHAPYKPVMFRPGRLASWWSRLSDLQWPEPNVRSAIRRRADALAEAGVDTVVQFGFHFRFDFAPYFGSLHGYLSEVAEKLHERHIRFLDHYSCNLVARPNSMEEVRKYHAFQRHHVPVHPDPVAAETLGFAGHRFNDLREVDVETGGPSYTWAYQAEMFCHTNPEFLAMHEAYLRRHLADIQSDGFQVDDMCRYAYFRACACRHCRERFAREYGRELPPFTDKIFWGDTSKPPTQWGNYDNPAFRDWVRMRYQTHTDHLAMVRRVIGNERVLMSCCSCSGPMFLNSLGLSYERFMEPCDWVLLENCGLGASTTAWTAMEPEAMLHKAVAATKTPGKPAPAVACSYAVFRDGAYLGWAIARFWGVQNWISTLVQGLDENPVEFEEEAGLIGSFNRWELNHPLPEGCDVDEVRVVFLRSAKEDGWRDAQGREHWTRMVRWVEALAQANIGYRFVLATELADARLLMSGTGPLIMDGCPGLTPAQRMAVEAVAESGGKMCVVPPVDATLAGPNVIHLDPDAGPQAFVERVAGLVAPRIRRVSGYSHWRLRLRTHGNRLVLHVLNGNLEGVEHPSVMDRWMQQKVLHRIRSRANPDPLVVELDLTGLPDMGATALLSSPELSEERVVRVEHVGTATCRLMLDLRGIRAYAQVYGTV